MSRRRLPLEPSAHHVGQRRAAADRVQRRRGRGVDHFVAAQHVGDLPNQQPHVVPVERDLREVEQRLAVGEPRRQRLGRRLDPRRGDAALHAAHRFDQIDLQRRGRRQSGWRSARAFSSATSRGRTREPLEGGPDTGRSYSFQLSAPASLEAHELSPDGYLTVARYAKRHGAQARETASRPASRSRGRSRKPSGS